MKRTARGPLAGLLFLALVAFGSAIWLRSPGIDVRDGRHDRGRNGIALGVAWIGGDAGAIAEPVRQQRIAEIYLQLPPPNPDGTLPGLDPARIEALLYECYEARGWARIDVSQLPLFDTRCRRFFISDLRRLLDRLPRLRGVQLDFANIAEVSPDMLALLDELRPVLAPDARPISVAVGAWQEPYFREVARRADQVVVPLEAAASTFSKMTVARNTARIGTSLAWCEGKPVLFRIPSGKQLRHSLAVLHAGLNRQPLPEQYQGVIVDAGDDIAGAGWTELRERFLRP